MDEIKLPRHVLDRLERRWAARFPQPMQHPQRATSSPPREDPFRSPRARRRPGGSPRSPMVERALEPQLTKLSALV
jgi:hypothetical protein